MTAVKNFVTATLLTSMPYNDSMPDDVWESRWIVNSCSTLLSLAPTFVRCLTDSMLRVSSSVLSSWTSWLRLQCGPTRKPVNTRFTVAPVCTRRYKQHHLPSQKVAQVHRYTLLYREIRPPCCLYTSHRFIIRSLKLTYAHPHLSPFQLIANQTSITISFLH